MAPKTQEQIDAVQHANVGLGFEGFKHFAGMNPERLISSRGNKEKDKEAVLKGYGLLEGGVLDHWPRDFRNGGMTLFGSYDVLRIARLVYIPTLRLMIIYYSLWPDILQKVKASGPNAVGVSVHMGLLNPSRRVMDFDGFRALKPLYEAALDAGIWIVLRLAQSVALRYSVRYSALGYVISCWNAANKRPRSEGSMDGLYSLDHRRDGLYQSPKESRLLRYRLICFFLVSVENTLLNLEKSIAIVLPFTYNDPGEGRSFINGAGAVNLYGMDAYPQRYDCSHPLDWHGVPLDCHQYHEEVNLGGLFDAWGPTSPGNHIHEARLPEFNKTDWIADSSMDLSILSSDSVFATYLLNPDTQAVFYIIRHKPTLGGRQSKVIVTNYAVGSSQLLYSTASIPFAGIIDGKDVLFIYGDASQKHEIAQAHAEFRYYHLLLPYWDSGPSDVLRLLATTDSLRNFWGLGTNQSVLVGRPYLVRSASISRTELALKGDLNVSTPSTIIAPAVVSSVTWNGAALSVNASSSLMVIGGLVGELMSTSVDIAVALRLKIRPMFDGG
ncbi:uncharacterized protein ARMOST_07630 [Armillaria ostoyae]|uniref:Beta-galactosidase domain-containing protein n=1 Tax=Armillaria ostoyae TaxID=47428 RepID=A0A284R6F8_ARMOS|nr:uncharacterized protein ARMOST_07630 [Armillaria ostoyae]